MVRKGVGFLFVCLYLFLCLLFLRGQLGWGKSPLQWALFLAVEIRGGMDMKPTKLNEVQFMQVKHIEDLEIHKSDRALGYTQ